MSDIKKPFVTIAIPTYNRADKYLRQTLECATNQAYENIEILVSDNCSTDHTEDLVRSFTDPRIKYFKQESNLGSYGNTNFLLKEASGDYFHMYHDDDRIDNDFIETCMKGAEYRKGLSLIMTGSRVIDADDHVLRENENIVQGSSIEDFILAWYKGKFNIFFCSSLFNTKILRTVGGFEPKYNHYIDVAAQFKCAAAGERLDIPNVKASFRHHEGSMTSSTHIDEWAHDSISLIDLACTLAPGKRDEIRKVGLEKSAQNVYMYANEIESKKERFKAFWSTYKYFNYRHLPPMKYSNQLIPFLGFVLHPYRALSLLKHKLLKSF